jgi:hypothetical protein
MLRGVGEDTLKRLAEDDKGKDKVRDVHDDPETRKQNAESGNATLLRRRR